MTAGTAIICVFILGVAADGSSTSYDRSKSIDLDALHLQRETTWVSVMVVDWTKPRRQALPPALVPSQLGEPS
jgi:hypothetical protein